MFAFGGSSTLLTGRHDVAQERNPPELPTPVKFPNFQPPARETQTWKNDDDPPALLQELARIRKPADITIDQLRGLNVTLEPECSIEELLSVLPGVASYVPPKEWAEVPADGAQPQPPSQPEEGPKRLLSSGRPYPGREDFAIRLKELLFDNQEAFAALTRVPQDKDKKPPRLAHYRKFWEGLDNMAYYWDTSLDEYIPPRTEEEPDANNESASEADDKTSNQVESKEAARLEATHIDESLARKKAKTAASAAETEPSSTPSDQSQPLNLAQRPAITPAKLGIATPPSVSNGNKPEASADKPAGTYKGLRIGNGRGMPDGYRVDTVRSFVEPVAWCFGMSIAPHRRPPALQVQNLRVPVRVSAAVWRNSTDRLKARQGFLHGPVAGMRVADYTDFAGRDAANGRPASDSQQEALLDVMREIGSLLHIAQERAREGRTEVKPGEGKWWTTVPRWGGGSGGDVGEARGDSDAPAPKTEKDEKALRSSRRPTKKKTTAEIWAELRPGVGYWDPKVEYEAIGKDRSSEWDDVFTVSSVNTHLSLLHLRVHPAYISWLETGKLPSPLPADENWCRPVVRRTRWYDFFDTDDRVEATRGLWGLFGWMARPQEEAVQNGNKQGEDVVMKDV